VLRCRGACLRSIVLAAVVSTQYAGGGGPSQASVDPLRAGIWTAVRPGCWQGCGGGPVRLIETYPSLLPGCACVACTHVPKQGRVLLPPPPGCICPLSCCPLWLPPLAVSCASLFVVCGTLYRVCPILSYVVVVWRFCRRRKAGEAVVSRERRLFVVGSKGVGKVPAAGFLA
jgi:hypothetical protein